jgi:Ca-activated chloride channel family protein
MKALTNYYSILGVPRDASPDEIRAAYRELARRFHPDTSDEANSSEQFIRIQKAFEVLNDPKQRQVFDTQLPSEIDANPIRITSLFSRGYLQRISEAQVFYAFYRFSAREDLIQDYLPPLNVCLLIDCSTSMQGIAMDTLKSTAISLVRQLRPEDIISVVTFADHAEVIVPTNINQEPARIEASIRMLRTGGGTEIFKGLEKALKEVKRYRSSKRINHIILITDGRTYGDEKLCLELASEAGEIGIGISGLGIGTKWNDAFLDQLVSRTGGSSVYIANPRDIEHYLTEKFSGLNSSYADNLQLAFRSDELVELRSAFRLQPDTAPLNVASQPVRLGTVPRQGCLEIMLEFLVQPLPEHMSHVNLLDGRLYLEVPGKTDPHVSIRMECTRATSDSPDPLPPPQAIVQSLSHVTLYQIQEHARQDMVNGKVNEATRKLQYLATHLIAQGQRDLARTVLGEAVHIQQKNSFSEEGEKRIKYGTRALLLPAKSD